LLITDDQASEHQIQELVDHSVTFCLAPTDFDHARRGR
jgi:hypothetical protein